MSSAEAAVATPEPVETTPAPAPAAAAATEKTESEPAATTTATAAAAAETKSHFVQRLASLPLVADSLEYARATVTDESKPYAKYTVPLVGKAAQVLALAQEATAPYAEKLQGPLATADALASKGLDFVEKQFPVVTRPTGEVAAETKRAVDDAIAKVRSPIANAATAARELPSRVVSTADAYVESYLPAKTETGESAESAPAAEEKDASRGTDAAAPADAASESLVDTFTRAVRVGLKVPQRITQRVAGALPAASSTPAVDATLQSATAVLEQSRATLASIKASLDEQIAALSAKSSALKDDTTRYVSGGIESLQATATTEVHRVSELAQSFVGRLPEPAQQRIKAVAESVSDKLARARAEVANPEASNADKARAVLHIATESIPYVDTVLENLKQNAEHLFETVKQKIPSGTSTPAETKEAEPAPEATSEKKPEAGMATAETDASN